MALLLGINRPHLKHTLKTVCKTNNTMEDSVLRFTFESIRIWVWTPKRLNTLQNEGLRREKEADTEAASFCFG